MLTSKEDLFEGLNNLLTVENSAKNSYETDLTLFKSKKILNNLEKIRDQEINHIKILKDLIKLLK